MEIAKLQFTSPLHLSRGKTTLDESLDVLHSDTLKSALFVCALDLFGDEILRGGDGDGKNFFERFTISSAFPFTDDTLFFPKPEWLPQGFGAGIDRKELKKVKYLSKNTFQKLLKGEATVLSDDNIKNIHYYTETKLKDNEPLKSETVQRVTVNRTYEEEGDTFYTERLYFTEGCGLFFLIEFHDDVIRPIIEAALRLLGDNGIGSDKSVGNGQFDFEHFDTFDFDFVQKEKANKQVALSLYCPNTKPNRDYDLINDPDFLKNSAYSLIKRGGYIANPDNFDNSTLRKKSIVMFTEGAVFPKDKSNERDLVGDVKDIKPDSIELREKGMEVKHPIWRDGRAMFFPYKLDVKDE